MRKSTFSSCLLLLLIVSGTLAVAAEKRSLHPDSQLLARARQFGSQNSAAYRALFGLSQREDLKPLRSTADRNGVTHTRYSQTIEGVPVWGEQIIISRDRANAIVGLRGTLVSGLGNDLPQVQVALNAADALNAMKERVRNHSFPGRGPVFKNETSELVVYLDNRVPKLSYSVSFFADTAAGGQPTRPYFIVDAVSGAVLHQYEGLTHAASSLLSLANISGSAKTWNYYTVNVSAGQKALYVTTTGLNGDADLYIRYGAQPTTSSYACQSIGSNSNESCVVNSPQAGTWYIGIYAYSAYSGVALSAKQFDSQDLAGGPGGNLKTGQYVYGTNYPRFEVLKDGTTCILNDPNVKTVNLGHSTSGSAAFVYNDATNQCWNQYNTTANATINGAYTPLNDAHFFGGVVYDMYKDWLNVPPLTFQLTMRVHYSTNYENAFWDGSTMTFGDGFTTFYPLVSLDVSSHEVSHGFTEQNSALIYSGQSGGINEAFSDMAGEAAKFYMRGTNDFKVGYDIIKSSNGALRYMCNPPQDGRSIDNAANYYNGLDVHYSSGVFNKAFCLLAQSSSNGWNTQTAFETFARANMNYWTPSETFVTAARGVYDSACAASLNIEAVVWAFASVGVGIDTAGSPCAPQTDSPPAVAMIAPSNPVGGTVTLSANASDDHGVLNVEFFVDGASIGMGSRISGSTTSGVWSINWNSSSVQNGNHLLTAKATDNASPSHATASSAITVEVNNASDSSMHVAALTGAASKGAGGKWNAIVTVTVHNAAHTPLANASVSGAWSNGASGSGSCTTNSLGQCSMSKSNLKAAVSSVAFTVKAITLSSYTYDSTKNDAGVSSPASVIISKPLLVSSREEALRASR